MLVTHRVAAASRCDSILVLDDGKIVAQGTHDELVKMDGLYAAFAEEQSAESELEQLDAAVPAPSQNDVPAVRGEGAA